MTSAPARGFTLLEMLVAISVLTVLVSLVYGMLRMGSRSWESSATRIEATETMRIGWSFLQRALNNARAVPTKIPETEGIHFIGDSAALEFVTDLPAYLGTGGLHAIGLGMEDDPDGEHKLLVLYRIPLGDYEAISEGEPEQLQQAILAENVEELTIEYYGVDSKEDSDSEQAAWTTEWQYQKSLPILVKLLVTLTEGEAWPILVAHPHLGSGRQDDGLLDDEELDEEEAATAGEGGDGPIDESELQGEDLIMFRRRAERERNNQ